MDDETKELTEIGQNETQLGAHLQAQLQKSPRIRDGLAVFGAIVIVWLGIDIFLSWLRPSLTERELVYLSSFLTQGSMAVIIGVFILWRRIKLKTLGYRKVAWGTALIGAVKAYLLVFILNVAYSLYLSLHNYQPSQPEGYKMLFAQHDFLFVLLNLVLATLIAPILEETLFRGIIYRSLRSKLGMWPSAVLSAALFSGLHFDFWGFLPRFFLGVALAYLYEKKGSLYPSMTLHALNNGIALLLNLATKLPT